MSAPTQLPYASDTLTLHEAFQTASRFLENYRADTDRKVDELGLLLTEMEMLSDGSPLDPGLWQAFVDARDQTLALARS